MLGSNDDNIDDNIKESATTHETKSHDCSSAPDGLRPPECQTGCETLWFKPKIPISQPTNFQAGDYLSSFALSSGGSSDCTRLSDLGNSRKHRRFPCFQMQCFFRRVDLTSAWVGHGEEQVCLVLHQVGELGSTQGKRDEALLVAGRGRNTISDA